MDKIESYISLLAGVLIVLSQFVFMAKVWNGKTTPSLFSWIGWAILIGQSFLAQYFETGWEWALVGIGISSLGCILISIVAIIRKNYSLKKNDWIFLVLGLSCVLVQMLFKSAFITTVFAIIADFILGVPTFIKTYRDPSSESKSPWVVSIISWALTMTIAYDRGIEIWIFPLYLLVFCLVMVILTMRNIIE